MTPTYTRRPPRAPGGDRGSATLELAVLTPALLLFIAAIIVAGRIQVAGQAAEEAARDAARQASIARTQAAAQSNALSAARSTLGRQGLQCARLAVTVDTTGFSTPVGRPATVSATVTCAVALSDLALPGLPGSHTVRASFTSPLDTYRERALGLSNPEGLARTHTREPT